VRPSRLLGCLILVVPLATAAPAAAAVPHVVGPGDTLWSIAAAHNLTTRTVAAYNGLSPESAVVLGSTVKVPSVVEGAAALQAAGVTPAVTGTTGTTGTTAPSAGGAPAPLGSYKVRQGDTLSQLAATARVSASAIATMNGLSVDGPLVAGTVIKLPTGSQAAPTPTATRLDAGTVQQVAAQHGVPPSLAAAIGWQESGFNNAMVSSANARGVMQVMPGTWSWVQENLAARPLDPDSAVDNVHAGVLYLRQLLNQTGGDESAAIAAYYQGLASVRDRGLFDDTKRYVANVQALRGRFGG
jgi:LysM repeat protein